MSLVKKESMKRGPRPTTIDEVLQRAIADILQSMAEFCRHDLGMPEAEIEQIIRQKTMAVTRGVIEEPDCWIALEWLEQNGKREMRS